MEAVKKYWFWGILISILSIFAMSHNVNAIDFTYNLNNYERKITYTADIHNCYITGGQNIVTGTLSRCEVIVNGITRLHTIEFNRTFDVKKGDLIEFYFLVTKATSSFYDGTLSNFQVKNADFALLNYESVQDMNTWRELYSTNGHINQQGVNYDLNINFEDLTEGYSLYKISAIAVRDNSSAIIGLNDNGSSTGIFSWPASAIGTKLYFQIRNINIYRFVGSEENKEVEEKTQEAVDQSESAGGDSSTSAQTGTTGLLNAITGAVSVISSAQPTNCKINGNMGNLDIGQLDLCANPAPAFVQTIGSLILILMCVPLAISLFNRFIAIFRSFQS